MALSKLVILFLGAIYPAYGTFKVLKLKNPKLYGKWMMYWISFACFTFGEAFGDVLFGWFTFYYWCKIIFVLWLLSPVTRGSSILYRQLIHPLLRNKEDEIDECIAKIKHAVLPFVYSPPSCTSVNSWQGDTKFENGELEKIGFWLSNSPTGEEIFDDTNPIEIELRVKYKSGATKMLARQIGGTQDVENKIFCNG